MSMFNVWKERFENDHPQYEIIGESFTYSVEAYARKDFADGVSNLVYRAADDCRGGTPRI